MSLDPVCLACTKTGRYAWEFASGEGKTWWYCEYHHDVATKVAEAKTLFRWTDSEALIKALEGPKACNCPMDQLLRAGCKCGGK